MPSREITSGWAFKVIFRLCRSDIFTAWKLYCCYAAVVLYSPPKLGEAQYHLRSKYNWRSQYNSPQGEYSWKKHLRSQVLFSGGGGRIRTIEAIRSRFTVCPLWPLGNSPRYSFRSVWTLALVGAGRRTRTPDLLITNQLLYQLSYTGGSNRTRLL